MQLINPGTWRLVSLLGVVQDGDLGCHVVPLDSAIPCYFLSFLLHDAQFVLQSVKLGPSRRLIQFNLGL